MKLLGIPLLQSYTTEERRKLLIARSVPCSFCSAEDLHGDEWLGVGNWRKRLLGDRVWCEFITQKDVSFGFFIVVLENGGSSNVKSNFSAFQRILSLLHTCAHSARVR